MILAIDIGNTNIVIGGFEHDELMFVTRFATNPSKTDDEYASKIFGVFSLHGIKKEKIDGAIISSVVPALNNTLKNSVKSAFDVDALMVGPGIKTGLNIHCDNPSSVGADLICAAVATKELYGYPSLIIDMGTATKMLVLDDSGSFVGVSIIPGLKVSLGALTGAAAQLPQISLEAPRSVLGKNTTDSMRSGVIFGHASMLDGMIDRFDEELGHEHAVYATGGLTQNIICHCKHDITTDKDLVLKGLNIIYKKNT